MLILRLLGYLWAAPVTMIGVLLWLAGGPKNIRWSEGCIEAVPGRIFGAGNIAGQTWGWLILYRDTEVWDRGAIRVHERMHVLQTLILGVLFLPAYGAHFGWLRWVKRRPYQRAYRGIWAEKAAYAHQDRYMAAIMAGSHGKFWGSNPPS